MQAGVIYNCYLFSIHDSSHIDFKKFVEFFELFATKQIAIFIYYLPFSFSRWIPMHVIEYMWVLVCMYYATAYNTEKIHETESALG